jgi:hypothetical protein
MGYEVEAPMWLVVGAGVAAAFQLIGHWFPWAMWFGGKLPRLLAYTWGLTGVIGGFAVWAIGNGQTAALAALVMVALAAGVVVVLAYSLDRLGMAWAQARMANRQMADDAE